VLSCLPSIAELGRILISMTAGVALTGAALGTAHTIEVISHGFIVTAMLWGAIAADLIDGRMLRAAVFAAIAAVLSAFGLIHSTVPTGALYLPWESGSRESALIAVAYAGCGVLFVALSSVSSSKPPTDGNDDESSSGAG
jgi:AGZA family xanthine/uracil permease-like MFS transporter